MSIILNDTAPNNGDWNTQFQFSDGETDDLLDFTGAFIEIEVKDADHCKRISATTDNGMIAIVGTGTFDLNVPAATMKCLCPGAYLIGGYYTLSGATISLFTGSLSIIDGVAR